MTINWKLLSNTSDARLLNARGQLHQAAQLLAAAGISYIEARPDDSHTAMLWDFETNRFLSQAFGNDLSFQVALNPSDLTLSIIKSDVSSHEISLNGISLKQAAEKLQSLLEGQGLPENIFTMEKHYELPDYPDQWDLAFDTSDSEAFQTLANSYGNAYSALLKMASSDARSGDILVWPHHFDLAFLINVAEDKHGNLSKSIGLGISPGDGSYTAPYYYVTAWPAPTIDEILGKLKSAGKWHTEGWIGMVLPLDPISSVTGTEEQENLVQQFLSEALSVAKSITD